MVFDDFHWKIMVSRGKLHLFLGVNNHMVFDQKNLKNMLMIDF